MLEPALVERLLADAADEPGSLPFVQETMLLLWEHVEKRRLPLAAYTRLAHDDGRSGLQMAMAYRADHAYQVLSVSERMLARRIFLRLVQFGEGRPDTRRQMSVADLRASGDDSERFDKVLLHLVDQRLLILSMDDTDAPKADIAHEQLLHGWPLLHEWINQRRDAEQTRRRLETKADEWVRLGKGEGGRLDEFALAEADHWLASPDASDLGVSEQLAQFVDRSHTLVQAQQEADEEQRRRVHAAQMEAEQERKQTVLQKTVARQLRRRAAALLVALAAALLAVVAAVWLFRDARIARVAADEARRSEQTLHLAAESAIERSSSPQLGFLMALEAANWLDPATQRPIPAAIHALRSQFDQWTFWRATLTGHQERVLALAFGRDDTQLFSSSVDGEVRTWMLNKDASHAQSVASLQQAVDALAVHPVQTWLAAGTQEGAIHLLDMDNGYAEVLGWQAHDENDRVLDIVFSADGKTLASSGAGGTIRLWSVETLPSSPDRIITIPNQDECWPPSECWVRALDISRDHRFLAAGAQNRRLYLWDLSAPPTPRPSSMKGSLATCVRWPSTTTTHGWRQVTSRAGSFSIICRNVQTVKLALSSHPTG